MTPDTRSRAQTIRRLRSAGLLAPVTATVAASAAALTPNVWLVGLATATTSFGLCWWLLRRPTAARNAMHPERVHRQIAQAIIRETPDAVLFFSDAGIIRLASPAARELFFEGRDPVGYNFLKLVANVAAPLREALLGDSDRLFSLEVEGRQETYHLSRRTFTLDGELHTLLIVRYLTREIARREVEVLKRVIRVLSHEVNNSLAPISSLIHSARRLIQPSDAALSDKLPKLVRVFDTIEERAAHLKTFLEGYARLARLPTPRLQRVPFSSLLASLAQLYPEVQLPEPPTIEGWFDPTQLEQVLINLLKNAHESGSPAAAIALQVQVEPNGATSIEVLDEGQGFGEEALRNALLPLYTTKQHGSGMGLALSHEIVEAHGGQLSVRNRKQGGAVISINLPGRNLPNYQALTRSRLTLTRA